MVKQEYTTGGTKRKRKQVSDNERKRAAYSCDRCKKKKIACKRSDVNANKIIYDNTTPCIQCVTVGVECTTTVPRKKRSYYSMSDTSRYQLKCLIHLFKVIHPDKDPNNLADLASIAHQLQTNLPPGAPSSVDDNPEMEQGSQNNIGEGLELESNQIKNVTSNQNDNAFINGLNGTPSIMKALLDLSKSEPSADSIQSNTEIVGSKTKDAKIDNYTSDLMLLSVNNFPLVDLISKKDADSYVDSFFKDIHPGYFIFNEQKFRVKYEALFKEIELNRGSYGQIAEGLKVRKEEICYIYLVWILGIKNYEYNKTKKPKKLVKIYLQIVKLLMGDIVISPSLEGIRSLYMIALYFETQKKRENSWLLFILASQQCVSLGFHRNSVISKYPEDIQDEIKTVWWSIFRINMNINSSLGRFPTIFIESVDIGLPKLLGIQDQSFKNYFCSSVGLFKIMYTILQHRKKLFISNDPLAFENIEQLVEIKNMLNSWYQNLPKDLAHYWYKPIRRYRVKLHLQYHYICITLILPYLLFISRKIKDQDIKKLNSLVYVLCHGIKSAEELCQVIGYSNNIGFSIGLLNYDLFYAYNATMVLVLTNILLVSKNIPHSSNINFLRDILNKEFHVNQNSILNSINQVYEMVNSNDLESPNGYMKECNDNIKLLINKFGLKNSLARVDEIKKQDFSFKSPGNSYDNIFSLSPASAIVYGIDPTGFEVNYNQNTSNDNILNYELGFSQFERSNFIFNENYFIDPSLNNFDDPFDLANNP